MLLISLNHNQQCMMSYKNSCEKYKYPYSCNIIKWLKINVNKPDEFRFSIKQIILLLETVKRTKSLPGFSNETM